MGGLCLGLVLYVTGGEAGVSLPAPWSGWLLPLSLVKNGDSALGGQKTLCPASSLSSAAWQPRMKT